jgi:hypothetical protein
MGLQIQDGAGNSYNVKVTKELQLTTQAETHELQHHISRHEKRVYQVVGRVTGVSAGVNTILHIRNTSSTLHAVVSYMRIQAMSLTGGISVPASASYFQIGKNTIYSSGGVEVTPSNMNFTSGNIPDLKVYKESPTLTGTFTEFDAWYNNDSMMVFNKHGSLIMGRNDSMEIRFVTDHTNGLVYARVTLMMLDMNGD